MVKDKYTFEDFLEIVEYLRSDKGCPWDREQNHETIKQELIEETYEVLEAIDLKNDDMLKEELGDLMLQVVFHSQVAKEENSFNINDVITDICKKLVYRHPHVFGDEEIDNSKDVINRWEKLKKKEKGVTCHTDVLKNVPPNLPALIRSFKLQKKAAQVGFDWDNIDDVFKKLHEEIDELREAIVIGDENHIEEEMGDLLFASVNLARFAKVQPELALTRTSEKFIKRFEFVETEAKKQGKELENMTLAEMDKLWNKSKEKE